jgi:hypothetical protein
MTIYWTIWLFGLLPITFGIGEAYALWNNKPTLSQYVWRLSKAWPPFPFVAGFLTGFLACHFWWGGMICFIGCAASPVSP